MLPQVIFMLTVVLAELCLPLEGKRSSGISKLEHKLLSSGLGRQRGATSGYGQILEEEREKRLKFFFARCVYLFIKFIKL